MEGYKKPESQVDASNPAILSALSGFYNKLMGTPQPEVAAVAPAPQADPYEQAAQVLSNTAQQPKGQLFMQNNPFKK